MVGLMYKILVLSNDFIDTISPIYTLQESSRMQPWTGEPGYDSASTFGTWAICLPRISQPFTTRRLRYNKDLKTKLLEISSQRWRYQATQHSMKERAKKRFLARQRMPEKLTHRVLGTRQRFKVSTTTFTTPKNVHDLKTALLQSHAREAYTHRDDDVPIGN